VLRDAEGNTQTLSGLYYQARQLLRKGLTDYDYHVGFLRPNPFGSDDAYGPFAALGEYRLGLSDAVTVGARLERTAGMLGGGPQFDIALPIGHVSLEAAASSAFGAGGHAFGAAYDYSSRRFGISVSAQTQSASYSTASLQPNAPRQRSSVRESFGLPISRAASLNISNSTTTYNGQPASAQLLASVTLKPRRLGAFINLSAERDTGGSIFGLGGSTAAAHWTFGAQMTFQASRSSNLTIGTSNAAGTSSTTLALSKSAPDGPGFGYQVQGAAGADRSAAAQVSYKTQYGDIQASSNSGVGPASTSLTLTGGLVGFRQGVFFTAPVSGAYALVDVPGFAHIPVFSNNQYAGRTDGRDEMVVPNLSPFYDNEVGIDKLDDRLDLTEEKSVEAVRPKNLSGVVTKFTITHFHAYAGTIVVQRVGRSIIPVLGRVVLSHAGNDVPSDLGREGQFYLENLDPGNYAATVTTSDGLTCAFHIDLPNDASPVSSLGTLTCDARP
jgi:outer membrane usher protein